MRNNLAPGISRSRIAPSDVLKRREKVREILGIGADDKLLVMIGSGFVKKGLSRALFAVWSLSRQQRRKTRFIVIGEDNQRPFRRLAWFLGISKQVTFMSGRDDIDRFLFASDLLILPAIDEAAGIIILEAIVAGLPVLVTKNCGYAHYVEKSGMGEVLGQPFRHAKAGPDALNERFERRSEKRSHPRTSRSSQCGPSVVNSNKI